MKKLIKDIVEMDKAARNELEQIKEELDKVPAYVASQRPLIEERYKNSTEQHLMELKEKLQAEYNEKVMQTSVKYEKSLEKLRNQYKYNRERWLKEIFENCIDG